MLLGACSAALYLPTNIDADRSGYSFESLLKGRKLYVAHCGACHNLYLPEHFSQQHWKKELPEMQRKAKISDEETRLITNFILVHSNTE
jgi:mono/diheme cytochrome c family protein